MKKRIQVPDGAGGFTTIEAEARPGKTFEGQEKRFFEQQEQLAWEKIGRAAEAFNAFHKAYGTDFGLTQEELIAAAYLENLNLREYYPSELGGQTAYDEHCKKVWAWFEENKK